jgi:MarR family transcriptional repressor of emrRAB
VSHRPALELLEQHLGQMAVLIHGYPRELALLTRISALVERRTVEAGSALLKPHGLTYPMYQALAMALASGAGGLTPGEVAISTGERPTNVTHLCDELVDRGWLTRRRDPADRRRIQLELTAAGRRLLEELQPQMWGVWRRRMAGTSPGERRLLLDLLRRQHANLAEED